MTDAKTALAALGGSVADGATNMPNIPAVPASDNAALTNILSSMKLWMEKATGSGFTGFATKAELVEAGVMQAGIDATGAVGVKPVVKNMATPPAPSGLSASGAMTNIILTWDDPLKSYANHAYTEVWSAETNSFTDASLIGQGAGFVFSHAVGEDAARYYWIRFVSTSGVKGPFNSVNGTLGQTSKNVSYVLSTLTGALTTSQLSAALNSRIDLIDGPSTLPNSVAAKLQEEANTRAQAILNEASARSSGDAALQTQINTLSAASTGDLTNLMTALQQEQTARINGDTAEATARETLASQMRGSYTGTDVNQVVTGLLYSERTARSSADAAEASAREALASTVSNNYSTINAAISTEASTRATQDTAISDSVTALSATVTNNYNTLSSSITSEQSARSSADSALGTRIDTVQARLNTGGDVANAIVQSQTTANTAVTNAATAQSTADAKVKTFYQSTTPTASAVGDLWVNTADNNHIYRWSGSLWADAADARIAATASQVTTLQTTVNGNTTSIQTQATSINGLQGQYTVKVDNNGYVAGYGLASTLTNATPYAEFTIVADKFSIAPVATNASAADGSPFYHLTVPTIIDGVTVPAGTYMKTAFIADASINNAKIGSLAADKITTGTLAAGRIATNSITADKINGNSLSVINGTFSGNLQGATGSFSGALSGATGTFAGRLAAGVLDSSSFSGSTATYSSAGTFSVTVPNNSSWTAVSMRVTLVGAGGGGQQGWGNYSAYGGAGAGGAAGSTVTGTFSNMTPGATLTLTVGAGGLGGGQSGNGAGYPGGTGPDGQPGLNGGTTTLSGYLSASGGVGGAKWLNQGVFTYPMGNTGGTASWQPGYAGANSSYAAGGAAGGVYTDGGSGVQGSGGGGGAASNYSPNDYQTLGGNGGAGYAIIEFFDPNFVVTNTRYSNLITWLDSIGHGTVPTNAR